MRDTASNMPARICVDEVGGDFPAAYIRADIVEAMAEALRDARDALRGADAWIAHTSGTQNKGRTSAISAVSAALTSYREASNDKA